MVSPVRKAYATLKQGPVGVMVVDMQPGFLEDKHPDDLEAKVANQRAVLEYARDAKIPLIYVEYKPMAEERRRYPNNNRTIPQLSVG